MSRKQLKNREQNSSTKKDKISKDDLQQIANSLKTLSSRQEGEKLLKEKLSSKDDLIELTKYLDLNIKRNDSKDQIRSRLIESTIGFRLRSAAIQGKVDESPKTAV